MLRSWVFGRVWMMLAVLAVFAVPVNGAHLHLCFDGSEPSASVHYEDGVQTHHGAPGEAAEHNDADIPLPGSVIVKLVKAGLDLLPVLLAAVVILWGWPRTLLHCLPVPPREPPFIGAPLFLKPPLRGPPRF